MQEIKEKMYTKEDVRSFFDNNKILIGNRDVIPTYIVEAVFGKKAVDFSSERGTENGYGIGDFTLPYMTLVGVEIAATYCNISQIKESGVLQ